MTLRDDAENAGAAIEPTGASARPLAKAARIFLADDADEMRELIGFALEQDGYDVVEARDGREMLRLIRDAIFAETVRPTLSSQTLECRGAQALSCSPSSGGRDGPRP